MFSDLNISSRAPENHLRRLASLHQHLPLHTETLSDPQLLHASNLALSHVQALGGCNVKLDPLQVPFSDNSCRAVTYHGALAKDVLGLQLADQLGRVISSVLCDDGGQLSEKDGLQHDHACV